MAGIYLKFVSYIVVATVLTLSCSSNDKKSFRGQQSVRGIDIEGGDTNKNKKASSSEKSIEEIIAEGEIPPLQQVREELSTSAKAFASSGLVWMRLSKNQLIANFTQAFGADIANVASVRSQLDLIPNEINKDIDELYDPAYKQEYFDIFTELAFAAAKEVSESETLWPKVLSCGFASDIATSGCFGKLPGIVTSLWRHQKTATEDDLMSVIQSGASPRQALSSLFLYALLMPEAIKQEKPQQACGDGIKENCIAASDVTNNRKFAHFVSLTMTDQPADAELLNLTGNDSLWSESTMEKQIARLLASPAGKQKFIHATRYWLGGFDLPDLSQASASYYGVSNRNISGELQTELHDFLNHIFYVSNGNMKALLTSKASFPRTQNLADIFAVSGPTTNSTPVNFSDDRGGVLLRPSFMIGRTSNPSIILRGVYIKEHILCEPFAEPDPDAIDAALDEIGVIDPLQFSNREITDQQTSKPGCAGCHNQINPFGYPLEEINVIGQLVNEQVVIDSTSGTSIGRHPLNLRASLPVAGAGGAAGKVEIEGVAQLRDYIIDSQKVTRCMASGINEHFFKKNFGPTAAVNVFISSLSADDAPITKNVAQMLAAFLISMYGGGA